METGQKRLNELLAYVIAQAQAAGVPVSEKIAPEVRINRRAQNRFGCCVRKDGRYSIEITERVMSAEERGICQVLAHEVLHTCPGCGDHGAAWKHWAAVMNRRYGYDIARTDSFEKLGLADTRPVKYVVRCRKCGWTAGRMKRSLLVAHPERYRCRCGGTLQVEKM